MHASDFIAILPETILTITGMLVMLVAAFQEKTNARWSSVLTCVGLLGAATAVAHQWDTTGQAFGGVYLIDPFNHFFHLLFLLIALMVVLASSGYLERERLAAAEFYALLLFATVGMGIMASANELVLLFIGLEISSLSSYILVGFRRDADLGSEAALKYFLLGSFATAFLLYGIALMFGATGSTRLTQIQTALVAGQRTLAAQATGSVVGASAVEPSLLPISGSQFPAALVGLAIALIFVGLAFKVSAAPFHVWTPDVYEGAPTPVTAFLSTAPKAAAFAAFVRIFISGFGSFSDRWWWLLWLASVFSMFIGNLAALLQTSVKRMLAYSAIAHAGYILAAFTTHSSDGITAVLFYLAAYTFMNIGAFIVVSHVEGLGEQYTEIEDYAGLGYRHPALAAMLTIFLLSLIGVPLTAGFFGKFYIFRAAVHGELIWLTILGLLNSGIAAYYYLRVLVAMYMTVPAHEVVDERLNVPAKLALGISLAGTILLGVAPSMVLNAATEAAQWLQQAR